jgi:hypothetical protein
VTIAPESYNFKTISRRLWIIHFLVCLGFALLIWYYRTVSPTRPGRTPVIVVAIVGLVLMTLSLIAQSRFFLNFFAWIAKKWSDIKASEINRPIKSSSVLLGKDTAQITTKRQVFVALIFGGLILSLPLALIQFVIYPVLFHDVISNWFLYWLYLFFGVMLPGTLVIVRYTSWQMDWLAWLGFGWAVGHGLELVSLLIARNLNTSILFVVWIPVAYLLFFLGRIDWSAKVKSVEHPLQIGLALMFLLLIVAYQFFGNSEYKLSSTPSLVEDVWFHSENAVEFRDHAVMQDPRLAGEPFNYHVFGYAAPDAASLLAGDLLVHLLLRYVGLSAAWLATLLVFNTSRILFDNRILAAALGTFLLVLPMDYLSFFSLNLDSGGGVIGNGLYNSLSTVMGYIFLLGVALPLIWFYSAPRWRDSWIILLLTFAGSGSKVMVGPLLLCVGLGMVGWGIIFRWFKKSLTYSLKTSLIALVLIAVPVISVSIVLIFGPGSYSEAIKWFYSDYGVYVPMYKTLLAIFPSADYAIRTLWIVTFSPVILLGAALTTFWGRKDRTLLTYATFAWTIFGASLVPTMLTAIAGFSQLFFIYYGLCILSTLAGYGLFVLLRSFVFRPAFRIGLVAGVLFCFIIAQLIWPLTVIPAWGAWSLSVWPTPYNFQFLPAGDRRNVGKSFVLTDEIKDALSWARQHLSKDDVFVANLTGVPLYGLYSEHRAFYETTLYTPASLTNNELRIARYGWRDQLVKDWIAGKSDVLARMKQAGITYIFVDRLNGPPAPDLPGLAAPSFENQDFAIYAIP